MNPTMQTTLPGDIYEALTLGAVVGDYADDYDLDAARDAYIDAINDLLPDGATLSDNGIVHAPSDVIDEVRDLDWHALADQVDVDAILARHERP